MTEFNDEMTIQEARDHLRELAMADGHDCPVCTQFAKVYKRKVHASMAQALITIFKRSGTSQRFVEIAAILPHKQVADAAKLRYWGLIEEEPSIRSDGSERSGYWRITLKGITFVRDNGVIAKYAKLYNGRCLGFDGEMVTIKDSLGKGFNYTELMAGV